MAAITFGTVLAGVSAAVGAAGAIRQGQAQAQAAEAQAQAADYNRQVVQRNIEITEQNRKAALDAGRVEGEDKRREARRKIASLRASYGSSGFEMAGTPLDVLSDSVAELELDAQRAEHAGELKARDFDMQRVGLTDRAGLLSAESTNARRSKSGSLIGGFLSAAGHIAGAGAPLVNRS